MSEMTSNTISKFFDLIKFVCVLIGCYICKKKNSVVNILLIRHSEFHKCILLHRGSCLNRRLKEREKEREADARDRQREKEELEEIKRKLLDEGHPDPEAELMKVKTQKLL